jgi:hypothetical protein
MSAIYEQLSQELERAGIPPGANKQVSGTTLVIQGPVSVLVNTPIDASPYTAILLEYAPRLTEADEIDMVARCMARSRGFVAAVPWLLSLFRGHPGNGLNESHLWAVANSLATINDRTHYPDVIALCRDRRFGSSRQMLMGLLARPRTDEAYDVLIESLSDSTVRAHAIEALGRFGRTEAIPLLENLQVTRGLYESKARETALRRLRRKSG